MSFNAHVELKRPVLCRIANLKVSKSPTTVVADNGEVQTKEEAIVYCKELDLLVESSFSKIQRPFSHSGNSAKITDIFTSGPVVRNHHSSKMADEYNAARRTTYRSSSLVYRQALQSQLHLHLQQMFRITVRRDPSYESAETENTKWRQRDSMEKNRCMICQNGKKNSRRIWWMKEFQFTGTHPRVLLLSQLQSL